MKKILLIFLLLAFPVGAQSVNECGEWASARNLPEPWESHTATYAKGRIRLAVLDTLEPAVAAMHLMVLSPPLNELGERQCRTVSMGPAVTARGWPIGFLSLDFAAREARYDPRHGLVVTMHGGVYNAETGATDIGELTVTINQSTGEISAEVAGS
ncbi:MAG: hypothetical protein ACK5IP_05525 [Paracoccus sp. (in: a-proteobacteria)]